MANSVKGEVGVTIDGKVWVMVMDFNVMCEFEDRTGMKATEFLESFEQEEGKPPVHVSARLVREFIFCMLQPRQPDVTLLQAGNILSHEPDAFVRAVGAAFPDAQPDGEIFSGEAVAAPG